MVTYRRRDATGDRPCIVARRSEIADSTREMNGKFVRTGENAPALRDRRGEKREVKILSGERYYDFWGRFVKISAIMCDTG